MWKHASMLNVKEFRKLDKSDKERPWQIKEAWHIPEKKCLEPRGKSKQSVYVPWVGSYSCLVCDDGKTIEILKIHLKWKHNINDKTGFWSPKIR